MAEILGLASSIITIVEVAGKLGTNTIRLKRLWDEVQDVPVSIQRSTKRSLEYSRKAVQTLDTLVRDMESQISSARTSRRLVAQLKFRIKKDVIEDHQQRLTSALQLLSLSQQTYLIALSRAQPGIIISEIRNWRDSDSQQQLSLCPKDDNQPTRGGGPGEKHDAGSLHPIKSPVPRDFSSRSATKPLPQKRPGLLGSFTLQSYEVVESPSIHYVPDKARFFQARVQIPWFIQKSWDLSAVENGQVEYIVESLKNKKASIYDMNPLGYSLLHPGSVRQVIASFNFGHLDPAVPLELLRSGLAVAADFPPYVCSSSPDGICGCYSSSLIYEYFHALLNSDKSFHDWRCLARKALLGVSPLDIVHPHDGAFWNLSSILEALWKRQFLLLPFARWIQNAVTLWLEDLAAAGINLEEYMSLELLYSREFHQNTVCKDTKVEIQPGARLPQSGPSLVILSVGSRADDWSFSWDPCVEELSGEFWTTLEDAQIKVPGAWVDERTEDFECLMGDRTSCWFRQWIRNMPKTAIRDILKEEHKQQMRLRGLEWTERKDRERLRIRGMTTCEEFSPYKQW
ncbi:hypothetical protein DER46DRAFT_621802 [Fusarium sp. MPI-SDFR-AT-0072]|nr:hypothetical protein DER46DRAFT_621802 [Fusarium sp. MPI-SDFR-AT-0072]